MVGRGRDVKAVGRRREIWRGVRGVKVCGIAIRSVLGPNWRWNAYTNDR